MLEKESADHQPQEREREHRPKKPVPSTVPLPWPRISALPSGPVITHFYLLGTDLVQVEGHPSHFHHGTSGKSRARNIVHPPAQLSTGPEHRAFKLIGKRGSSHFCSNRFAINQHFYMLDLPLTPLGFSSWYTFSSSWIPDIPSIISII